MGFTIWSRKELVGKCWTSWDLLDWCTQSSNLLNWQSSWSVLCFKSSADHKRDP
jgi:hypothetical protein